MDIDMAWQETCKILLGCELGELSKFSPYLARYSEPVFEKKSALSGLPVALSRNVCAPGSKYISNDELPAYGRMTCGTLLDLNDIKDIDSLTRSIGEHFYYSGNQISGNSHAVISSDNIMDSQFISRSTTISGCKYVALSSLCLSSEYLFGVNWCGDSKFLIKCFDCYKQVRCMETLNVWSSSDVYFSAGLEDCTNCLFSFNHKHGRNLIGNRPFSNEEFAKFKGRLMEQVREEMKSKRKALSIIEILGA